MTLLRDERGFTLTELLVSMIVGIVVLLAAFQVVDSSLAIPVRTQNRVDAFQRGRLSMDVIASQIRSQVCLASTTPPIIPTSSNATDIWFYNNTGDQNAQPQMRHLYLTGGNLMLQTWMGTAPVAPATSPTFPGPVVNRTLLTNVSLVGTTPLFRYYGFDANQPANVNITAPIAVPISAADAARVVQVNVSFRVRPTGASADQALDSIFQQAVYFRTADPTDPAKGPKCQ